ncbi:DUF1799 domain-containing protein [Pokkaliibacter sp. CJK22405]|uniref:DUF1799 domain-containing protein n=1 Tax=Pokkaliibacter sp. CJK22405 TaxID=3384615 RepID=UPI0039850B49
MLGRPAEVIEKEICTLRADDVVDIWPEHVAAFELFNRCCTDWRMTEFGPVGLDGNVILGLISLVKPENPLLLYDQVRLIEQGALAHFSERKR